MEKQLFNNNWLFTKAKLGTTLEDIKKMTDDWKAVDVPHDWLIYDTNNLYESGEGWYKKHFEIESLSKEDYFAFRFDGIYQDSTIYINGTQAFEWKNGYTTFEFDATPFLTEGTNEIIVRVVYESPNSRWYSGAGIYRNVWFKTGSQDRFISDGIYVRPTKYISPYLLEPDDNKSWRIDIDAEVVLTSNPKDYTIHHGLLDPNGNFLMGANNNRVSDAPTHSKTLHTANPRLWDIGQGNLYMIESILFKNGEVVDTVITPFGFREIEMSPDGGFVINGRRTKLFGVCQHHDLGALGAAFNKEALRRQFQLLLDMGMNAIEQLTMYQP